MRTRTKLVSLSLAVVLPLAGMVNAGAEEKPAQGKQETGVVAPAAGTNGDAGKGAGNDAAGNGASGNQAEAGRALLLVRVQLLARVQQGSLVKKLVEAVQKSAAAATRSRGVANAAKREAVRLLRTKIIKR